MLKKNNSKYSNSIKAAIQLIFGLCLVFMIYSFFKKEINSLDFVKIKTIIFDIGYVKFGLIAILGFFGMAILSFYDFFVLKALKMNNSLKTFRIFKISFITNSINMLLGFGGIIGAGLRYQMYRPYTKDNKHLAIGIGMILISMLTGISGLAILVVFNILPGHDLYATNYTLYYFLLTMALFLPIYLFINIRKPKLKNDRLLSVKLATISLIEWIYAALLVLFILNTLSPTTIEDKQLRIIGVMVISSIAGILSLIPGGVGTFDILVLIGLSNLGFDKESVAASILIYRLSYYIIPFLIGVILLACETIGNLKNKLKRRRGIL